MNTSESDGDVIEVARRESDGHDDGDHERNGVHSRRIWDLNGSAGEVSEGAMHLDNCFFDDCVWAWSQGSSRGRLSLLSIWVRVERSAILLEEEVEEVRDVVDSSEWEDIVVDAGDDAVVVGRLSFVAVRVEVTGRAVSGLVSSRIGLDLDMYVVHVDNYDGRSCGMVVGAVLERYCLRGHHC